MLLKVCWIWIGNFTVFKDFRDNDVIKSFTCQVTRPVPSPGVPDVPSPVSHVSVEVVPTAPARLPSVTCAVEVTCSHPPRPTGGGTARSALPRSDTPSFRPLLPLVSLLSWWPKVSYLTLPTYLTDMCINSCVKILLHDKSLSSQATASMASLRFLWS